MAITAPSWGVDLPKSYQSLRGREQRDLSLPHFARQLPPSAGLALRVSPPHRSPGVSRPLPHSSRRSKQLAGPVGGDQRRSARPASPQRVRHLTSRRGVNARSARGRGHGLRYGLVALLAGVVALLVLAAPGISAQASRVVTEGSAQSVVTVEQGDSLWTVATRVMPDVDPRAAVREIRVANGLKGTALSPGQKLIIPSP